MEKLETLLNISAGSYDTPKKLNRSLVNIPASIIDQIEAGEMTSEILTALTASFRLPVFRYKTCITIHGHFDIKAVPRIGGYKNVILNQNGSLEIRYSAIDVAKKHEIAKRVKAVSDWRFYYDSQGASFQLVRHIDKAEDHARILAEYKAIAARIETVKRYGKISAYTANAWGQLLFVFDFRMDAIPAGNIEAMAEAMTGKETAEINTALDALAEKKAAEDQQRAIERAESDKRAAEIAAKRAVLEAEIKDLKPYTFNVGSIGIKTGIYKYRHPIFVLIRVTGKGSFGRVKYDLAYIPSLDRIGQAQFKPASKERRKDDFLLKGYRQLLTEAV